MRYLNQNMNPHLTQVIQIFFASYLKSLNDVLYYYYYYLMKWYYDDDLNCDEDDVVNYLADGDDDGYCCYDAKMKGDEDGYCCRCPN